jgi:hypothetical protein
MRTENALAIGVSNREFMNILLTYYPKGVKETFDVYLFIDITRVTIDEIKAIIAEHDIELFNNATFIITREVYDYYTEKHGYEGKAKTFLYNHGALFKVLMPIYLAEKFGVKRTYTSDDDIFIFNDLSYMFTEYTEFAYKKENLFNFKNKDKYEVLAAFNEIFESDFTLDEMNALSLNCGNMMYTHDDKLEYYFKRFMNHPMAHHLFFNFVGYVSWTVEQRFHHFNIHRLMREGRAVDQLKSKDLRLMQNVDKEALANGIQPIYLKQVTPSLLHYAIGTKKPIFLRQFLQGIEWKFGFRYEPKYELKDILYDESWRPPAFKAIHKATVKKTSPVF